MTLFLHSSGGAASGGAAQLRLLAFSFLPCKQPLTFERKLSFIYLNKGVLVEQHFN